jgi:glyoxylase-like metal-dependent hydrolase (beta-lactamase superfamily II)
MYIIFDNSKEAVIIDAPMDSAQLVESVIEEHKLKVKYLLFTHSHWDHTAGASQIIDLTKADVCIHEKDYFRLNKPNENSIIPLPFKLNSITADRFLKEGDEIVFGKIKLEVLETPGHTEGGICFVDSINKVIFAGDTIFKDSVGRTDLPGGNGKILKSSIEDKLFNYSDDFSIYCGHGPKTTIGYEKRNNPFVGQGSRGFF